jgi:hypothetical protein
MRRRSLLQFAVRLSPATVAELGLLQRLEVWCDQGAQTFRAHTFRHTHRVFTAEELRLLVLGTHVSPIRGYVQEVDRSVALVLRRDRPGGENQEDVTLRTTV